MGILRLKLSFFPNVGVGACPHHLSLVKLIRVQNYSWAGPYQLCDTGGFFNIETFVSNTNYTRLYYANDDHAHFQFEVEQGVRNAWKYNYRKKSHP
jgi:hypothetical protein